MRWDNQRSEWVDERFEETSGSKFVARIAALVFITGLLVTFLGLGLVFSGQWWVFALGITMSVGGDQHRKWYWKKYRKVYGEKRELR